MNRLQSPSLITVAVATATGVIAGGAMGLALVTAHPSSDPAPAPRVAEVVSPDPSPSADPTPSPDPSPSPDPTPTAAPTAAPTQAPAPAPAPVQAPAPPPCVPHTGTWSSSGGPVPPAAGDSGADATPGVFTSPTYYSCDNSVHITGTFHCGIESACLVAGQEFLGDWTVDMTLPRSGSWSYQIKVISTGGCCAPVNDATWTLRAA